MTNNKFDLERAKAGEDVVTRDGRKARYLCDIENKQYPHAFAVQLFLHPDTSECVHMFMSDGRYGENHEDSEWYKYDLFMAAPSIPADYIKYDPNVPPPEMAEIINVFYADGSDGIGMAKGYKSKWKTYNDVPDETCGKRIAWKVTKWKLPEGFKPHMGGERPADAVGSGKVCFEEGSVCEGELSFWTWTRTPPSHPRNIIGYLPDEEEKPEYEKPASMIAVGIDCSPLVRENLKHWLNQFAAAIVAECKKGGM